MIRPAQGICFAIPINMAKDILPQLLQHGRVIRGYLGLNVRTVPIPQAVAERHGLQTPHGVEVVAVESGGPADEAGLQEEDVIIVLGEQPTPSVDALHKLLTQLPVGVPVTVAFLRQGRRLERMIVSTDYPNPAPRV